ncbi:MAG: hypothetical protein QOH60_683 [Mycobacterium sp.]|nr:hypothetical protein [Mycobacterium sp.]
MTDGRDAPGIMALSVAAATPLSRGHPLAAYHLPAESNTHPIGPVPDEALWPQLIAHGDRNGPLTGPGRERVSRSLLMGAERTPSYCGKRNGTPHRSAIVTA